jgi:hypothetical protein
MAKKKAEQPPDPDRVVRESAGIYRTEDGRFELRQGGVGWYLVDAQRTNELGQELLHGPFSTLKEARDEIPQARKGRPAEWAQAATTEGTGKGISAAAQDVDRPPA